MKGMRISTTKSYLYTLMRLAVTEETAAPLVEVWARWDPLTLLEGTGNGQKARQSLKRWKIESDTVISSLGTYPRDRKEPHQKTDTWLCLAVLSVTARM